MRFTIRNPNNDAVPVPFMEANASHGGDPVPAIQAEIKRNEAGGDLAIEIVVEMQKVAAADIGPTLRIITPTVPGTGGIIAIGHRVPFGFVEAGDI